MRRLILAAGLAAATITAAANAQETCEQRRDTRTAGTVAGAGVGAILGGAIGGNALGAVLGAVGGGVAGNQLAKGPHDCIHAYGFYDNNGRWHPNRVDPAAATGFYDRDGRWVAGAPAGYYDRDGRWISTDASRGYRDANGYWVPAGAPGYYSGNGYVSAQPVAAPPPGYGNDPRGQYAGDPRDYHARIARIAERIDRAGREGNLTEDQARHARRDLDQVNRQASAMRHDAGGYLFPRDQQIINARLDEIAGRLRASRDQARNY
jgi:hypothetical protein